MSGYYGRWVPYISVEERRRKAEQAMAKLCKTGYAVAPVTIIGRMIATTVWGRAWCDNLESYGDYESRLPRGRTYVRNGSVVDLQIAPGRVTAVVSGSELYKVVVTIKETAETQWRTICQDCAGGIDSLVELLQGKFSKGVMERLCRQEGGLFPRPLDIRFSCSCPDHASLCKHVAAALYGVGARLDRQPELLFRLRAVNESELVAGIDTALPVSMTGPTASRVLDTDDISALFGLDMAEPEALPAAAPVVEISKRTPAVKQKRTVIVKTAPIRAAVPQQKPVARANPTQPSPTQPLSRNTAATAKGAAKLNAPKRTVAVVDEAGAKRQNSIKVPGQANVLAQPQAASIATARRPETLERGGGRPVNAKGVVTPVCGPKPKPVKWW